MTVNEFLEIVSLAFNNERLTNRIHNGIYENDELTFNVLDLASTIIDVLPEVDNISYAGVTKFEEKDGYIIAERPMVLNNGTQVLAKKDTPLSDSIDSHLKKFENVEQAVKYFVNILKELNESIKRIETVTGKKEPVNYEPVITKLDEFLQSMNQVKKV